MRQNLHCSLHDKTTPKKYKDEKISFLKYSMIFHIPCEDNDAYNDQEQKYSSQYADEIVSNVSGQS